jgi:hypothetical protein
MALAPVVVVFAKGDCSRIGFWFFLIQYKSYTSWFILLLLYSDKKNTKLGYMLYELNLFHCVVSSVESYDVWAIVAYIFNVKCYVLSE